jgi:DNA-binding response OmpR family regulator
MKKNKILLVEDDSDLAFLTKETLEDEGFEVSYFDNGLDALQYFKKSECDICIFDVMLPKMDGFELVTQIRKINRQIPIIFLTAKSLTEDKIHGLKIGGDDYITKPFEMEEILLKIGIFLKRKSIIEDNKELILINDFTFDPKNLALFNDNEKYSLTKRESDILVFLSKHKGKFIIPLPMPKIET